MTTSIRISRFLTTSGLLITVYLFSHASPSVEANDLFSFSKRGKPPSADCQTPSDGKPLPDGVQNPILDYLKADANGPASKEEFKLDRDYKGPKDIKSLKAAFQSADESAGEGSLKGLKIMDLSDLGKTMWSRKSSFNKEFVELLELLGTSEHFKNLETLRLPNIKLTPEMLSAIQSMKRRGLRVLALRNNKNLSPKSLGEIGKLGLELDLQGVKMDKSFVEAMARVGPSFSARLDEAFLNKNCNHPLVIQLAQQDTPIGITNPFFKDWRKRSYRKRQGEVKDGTRVADPEILRDLKSEEQLVRKDALGFLKYFLDSDVPDIRDRGFEMALEAVKSCDTISSCNAARDIVWHILSKQGDGDPKHFDISKLVEAVGGAQAGISSEILYSIYSSKNASNELKKQVLDKVVALKSYSQEFLTIFVSEEYFDKHSTAALEGIKDSLGFYNLSPNTSFVVDALLKKGKGFREFFNYANRIGVKIEAHDKDLTTPGASDRHSPDYKAATSLGITQPWVSLFTLIINNIDNLRDQKLKDHILAKAISNAEIGITRPRGKYEFMNEFHAGESIMTLLIERKYAPAIKAAKEWCQDESVHRTYRNYNFCKLVLPAQK